MHFRKKITANKNWILSFSFYIILIDLFGVKTHITKFCIIHNFKSAFGIPVIFIYFFKSLSWKQKTKCWLLESRKCAFNSQLKSPSVYSLNLQFAWYGIYLYVIRFLLDILFYINSRVRYQHFRVMLFLQKLGNKKR